MKSFRKSEHIMLWASNLHLKIMLLLVVLFTLTISLQTKIPYSQLTKVTLDIESVTIDGIISTTEFKTIAINLYHGIALKLHMASLTVFKEDTAQDRTNLFNKESLILNQKFSETMIMSLC